MQIEGVGGIKPNLLKSEIPYYVGGGAILVKPNMLKSEFPY